MVAVVQQWLERVNAMSLRERILLALVVVVSLVVLLNLLLLAPARQALSRERQAAVQAQKELAQVAAQITALKAQAATGPNARLRKELETIEARMRGLDADLEEAMVRLVTPNDMVNLLKDLMARQDRLTLLSVQSEPLEVASDLLARPGDKTRAEEDLPVLYRHGVSLVLEGDYLAAVAYLQSIEALPWHLFWDRLQITTESYPRARIQLRVYTLSLQEGWIGV